MGFTMTEFALAALALLFGVIAAIVAMRLRSTTQGPHHAPAVQVDRHEPSALPIATEGQGPALGSKIKPLSAEMRNHFITTWHSVQAQFVDDPRHAVARADSLLAAALLTRGYPLDRLAQRADNRAAAHPDVQYYRAVDEIAEISPPVEATTEDLRTAMIHFRSMFDNLVNDHGEYARQPKNQQQYPNSRINRQSRSDRPAALRSA